jgi:hypothetical protein
MGLKPGLFFYVMRIRCYGSLKLRNDSDNCNTFRSVLLPWLYSPYAPWPLIQFPNLYTVGRTPRTSDQPVERPLPGHRTAQTQNERSQTSSPRVGFEPTIPAFERAKTVRALDSAATVIGFQNCYIHIYGTRERPVEIDDEVKILIP